MCVIEMPAPVSVLTYALSGRWWECGGSQSIPRPCRTGPRRDSPHDLDVRLVARVDDRENEPAARAQDPRNRPDRRLDLRDVHQRHVGDDAVEALVVERLEILGVSPHIADAARSRLLEPAG